MTAPSNVVPIRDGDIAPPHSTESEQAILGILLSHPDSYDTISAIVRPQHFYRADNRLIYQCIADMLSESMEVGIIEVHERLRALGVSQEAGGMPYLGSLATSSPSRYNSAQYARIVRARADCRALAALAAELQESAAAPGAEPETVLRAAEDRLYGLSEAGEAGRLVSMGDAMDAALHERQARPQGLSTGLRNLDAVLRRGLREQHLIVLAGRPGMGKSALAMQISEHVAQAGHVAVFSLEMSAAEIADRSLSYHEHTMGADAARRHMRALGMHIDDTPGITLAHMRSVCRRIARVYGLDMIVVDHVQLMRGPRSENRTQEMSAISAGLKHVAKEFRVPLIALSQLNRSAEHRTDRRPMLSDLRESGSIEQDADTVIGMYRADYYARDDEARTEYAEALILKQRGGRTGMAGLRFSDEVTRFTDWHGPRPGALAEDEPPKRRRSKYGAGFGGGA